MDISLTGMYGVECVRQLAKVMELPQILMLTVHEDRAYLRQALEAGVSGYLLKRSASEASASDASPDEFPSPTTDTPRPDRRATLSSV